MWDVFQIIGKEAPAIAASGIVALLIGLAAMRVLEMRHGDLFDLRKVESVSTGGLAAKIMAMSADQNKTIATQCATIADQQQQIDKLRTDLETCVAQCAKCHEERVHDRAARALERADRDHEIAALKAAISAIGA